MASRDSLLRAYGWMEGKIAPNLRYSQSLYEEVVGRHVQMATTWLDLGCGRRVLPPWRSEAEAALVGRCRLLVGVDVDHDALADNGSIDLKCRASVTKLPFADGSFDLVTANMVVEHLEDPDTQFCEISRVLKPGGFFIFHTPNAMGHPTLLARAIPAPIKRRLAYHLDGRAEEDVYPTFYRANRRRAVETLARRNSFKIRELRFIVSTAVFALLLPIALLELIWLRILLMSERLKGLRTNIIAILQKLEPSANTQVMRDASQ